MNEETISAAAENTTTELAQNVAETTGTASEIQPTNENAAPVPPKSDFTMPMMLLLLLGFFYFMVIRPQHRREKERRKMLEELRVGAKVIVAGGIVATIVEAAEKTFKVETAAGTRLEVLRSAVQDLADDNAAQH